MIWTRVAVSITYDENHYTTGTSKLKYIIKVKKKKFILTDVNTFRVILCLGVKELHL